MLRAIFAFCLVAAVVTALPTAPATRFSPQAAEELFNAWTVQHGKSYSEAEVPARLAAFHANAEFVATHNERFDKGEVTYRVELNQFADMTQAEFKKFYLGFNGAQRNAINNATALVGDAPAEIDWRAKGAVNPVQNQGQCGSCWAFSTVASVEAANFLRTGKLDKYSEQELVDCDDNGDQGCNGGLMDNAFQWIQKNGGIDTEADFKYIARRTIFFRCPASKKDKHVGTVSGFVDVPAKDENQLKLAAAKTVVSVAIEADQPGFQMYSSGVFSGECGTNLDHGVAVVGYGTDNGQDYWIVRNSWGASWGEKGYIRLARNVADAAGQCGVAMAASYPLSE